MQVIPTKRRGGRPISISKLSRTYIWILILHVYREIIWNYSYSIGHRVHLSGSRNCTKMHSDTSQRIHCAYGLLMKQCKMNLFYSSVNKKYPSFTQAHFSDKNEIFQRIFFWGRGRELPLPRATTPLCRGGVCCKPYYPKHRVPVQIPDGYPGTKIPESPTTRKNIQHSPCHIVTFTINFSTEH